MKKIIFILFLSVISYFAAAENITQFTGGNYIYAENGKLTFNFDSDLVEARDWTYDTKTDVYVATFKINIPLRTKYTSEFTSYSASLKSPYLYATYNPNFYTSEQVKQFHTQRVFLPALGWTVRVGAVIVRQLLPPIITRCLSNMYCAGVVSGLPAACAFFYNSDLEVVHALMPDSVCKKAEQDGFAKDKNGDYVRSVSYVASFEFKEIGRFSTLSAGIAAVKASCPPSFVSPAGKSQTLTDTKVTQAKDSANVTCHYDDDGDPNTGFFSKTGSVGALYKDQKIQMVDISRYVADDIKDNPKQYINDKSELGKEIRKQAQVAAAGIVSDSGTFSVIGSNPYRNPETGKTVQDVVTVESAKPSFNNSLSGNSENHTSGISSITNNVNITTINRDDLEVDAPIGKPNKPNGNTGSAGPNKPNNSNKPTDSDGDDKDGKRCKSGDKTVGCMPIGDLPTDIDIKVPKISGDDMSIGIDQFLPSDGVCPAPLVLAVGSYSVNIEYEPMCMLAQKIRMLIQLIGALVSAFIIFKSNI